MAATLRGGLLAMALVALLVAPIGVAAQGAKRPPAPDSSMFASKPMSDSINTASVQYDTTYQACQKGVTVTGIKVWWIQQWVVFTGHAPGYTILRWGAVSAIQVFYSAKNMDGSIMNVTLGTFGGNTQKPVNLFLAPQERITSLTIKDNGFTAEYKRGGYRIGALTITTTKQTMSVNTEAQGDVKPDSCRDSYDGDLHPCPVYKTITKISPSVVDNPQWLGSGVFCGWMSALTIGDDAGLYPSGFVDLTPVFYRPIDSARIRDMTYPADLMQRLPPLNPMVSLNVRMDSRKGPASTLALASEQAATRSGGVTYTSGSNFVSESELKIGLQFPKIKALDLKNDASITTKSSWELSGEQESSTTFSESQTDTVTCKLSLDPKTWSQVSFVQYKGSYSVPYTAIMDIVFDTDRKLSFNTSGVVSGVSASVSNCLTCALDKDGCCPNIAPCTPKPKRRALQAAELPIAEPEASLQTHGLRALSQARAPKRLPNSAYFVSTPYVGLGSTGQQFGLDQCLQGKYLAAIQLFGRDGFTWNACTIKLFYTDGRPGTAAEVVTIAQQGDGNCNVQLGQCDFGPNDTVQLGVNSDNNRCHDGNEECRWGRLFLQTNSGKTCDLRVSGYGEGKETTVGPSQVENIGSGVLCGLGASWGSDINALSLVFMREVCSARIVVGNVSMTQLGPVYPNAWDSVLFDNRIGTTGEISQQTKVVSTNTQSWRDKNQQKYGNSTKFETKSSIFELFNAATTNSAGFSATKAVQTTGSLAYSSSTSITVTVAVPKGRCAVLQRTRFEGGGATSAIAYNSTRTIVLDSGAQLTWNNQGVTAFNTSSTWSYELAECANGSGSKAMASRVPNSATFRLTKATTRTELLKMLATNYKVMLAKLLKLNPRLPNRISKGKQVTIRLR